MTPPSVRLFASREAKDLRNVMQGKGAIAGEASYEGARRVFNGAVDRRPALFAFCESARDVQEAVRAARAYGLPLSVRGERARFSWAGGSCLGE
jgi:FAD/FMN-containing dehydrogenase